MWWTQISNGALTQDSFSKGLRSRGGGGRPRAVIGTMDHCACCWAKFAEFDAPDIQHEGYTTADRYNWVCEGCVTDLKDEMDWHLAPSGESGI